MAVHKRTNERGEKPHQELCRMENVLVEISEPIQDSRQQHSSAEVISQVVAQLGQALHPSSM